MSVQDLLPIRSKVDTNLGILNETPCILLHFLFYLLPAGWAAPLVSTVCFTVYLAKWNIWMFQASPFRCDKSDALRETVSSDCYWYSSEVINSFLFLVSKETILGKILNVVGDLTMTSQQRSMHIAMPIFVISTQNMHALNFLTLPL